MASHKTLIVMRHAKSSWKTNDADVRRPLSARGTRDAVVAGQSIAAYSPEVVWCSAATRAVQTWQCAELGGASCPDVRVSDALYGASAHDLLAAIRMTPASARTVLLIAHDPGVTDLVLSLAIGSRLTEAVEQKFPTAALAVLEHDLDWDELDAAGASLAAFTLPRG